MQEVIAGFVTVIDVVALYLMLPMVKRRFLLALWTAILHMIFPLIGFWLGDWTLHLVMSWGGILSSILLFLVGLQILFSAHNVQTPTLHPVLLAFMASIDAFSVSVSFGMLELQKHLFIITAGCSTFILSYLSLLIASKIHAVRGIFFNYIAALSLIAMSLYILFTY